SLALWRRLGRCVHWFLAGDLRRHGDSQPATRRAGLVAASKNRSTGARAIALRRTRTERFLLRPRPRPAFVAVAASDVDALLRPGGARHRGVCSGPHPGARLGGAAVGRRHAAAWAGRGRVDDGIGLRRWPYRPRHVSAGRGAPAASRSPAPLGRLIPYLL